MTNLKRLALLFTTTFLLSGCSAAAPGEAEEKFEDPIQYEKPVAELYHEPVLKDDDDEEAVAEVKKVILHYYNTDKKNGTREIYTWTNGSDSKYNELIIDTAGDEEYYHIELDYTGDAIAYAGKTFINFIVKYKDTWSGQSLDSIVDFTEFAPNSEGVVEVWTCNGNAGAIDIYDTKDGTVQARINKAYFTDWKTIKCEAADIKGVKEKAKLYRLYAFDKAYLVSPASTQKINKHLRLIKEGTPNTADFNITFNHIAHINVQYVLETEYESHDKIKSVIVDTYKFYDNKAFNDNYTYDGDDLGCTYTSTQTTFKVWAPTAGAIILNVYNKGTPKGSNIYGSTQTSNIKESYPMTMEKGGVWTKTLLTPDGSDSIENKYYTYTVYNSEGVNEICDPYAKASGVNGSRGMILDFDKTNPEGWDEIDGKWDGTSRDIKTPQELSIYEIHIRDLTEDSTWNGEARHGSFQAFYEEGTTYTGKDASGSSKTVKTGFDHIKELGVNAIQIMPVYDQDNNESYYYYKKDDDGNLTEEQAYVAYNYSGDEETYLDFNWGYNPLNYNCVEGSYSSNPEDGAAAVKEYKQLIYNYATKAGVRTIMDVVYNHVSSVSKSNFTKLMPRYYFRFNETTDEYYNGSDCSNEVKSEATMMSKFIVDSLCWWAKEYNVKGFRFDLMGLIDLGTLKTAQEELYKIDPDIYIYGEGWKSLSESGLAEKDGGFTWQVLYDSRVKERDNAIYLGCFNDAGRDELKGGNDGGFGTGIRHPGYGFMSQGSGDVGSKSWTVGKMMTGSNGWKQDGVNQNPKQSVNYASCHDNFTLYDQFSWTLNEDGHGTNSKTPNTPPAVKNVVSAVAATEVAIFMSNGVSFMQGGEELFRTKVEYEPENSRLDEDYVVMYNNTCISHNSYKSSTRTNAFDWSRKIVVTGYGGDKVSTASYWGAIQKALAARKVIAANSGFSTVSNSTSDSSCNYSAGDGASVVSFYMGGYVTIISGRTAQTAQFNIPSGASHTATGSFYVGTAPTYGSVSGGYKPVYCKVYSTYVYKV